MDRQRWDLVISDAPHRRFRLFSGFFPKRNGSNCLSVCCTNNTHDDDVPFLLLNKLIIGAGAGNLDLPFSFEFERNLRDLRLCLFNIAQARLAP